jgi:hypothetical protein
VQDRSFMCNALIEGRDPRLLRAYTRLIGNWMRGTATLKRDAFVFSTNRLNALLQEDGSPLTVPYDEIADCRLGRYALLLKTVDLTLRSGESLRVRCLLAWNETLLADLRNRMAARGEVQLP